MMFNSLSINITKTKKKSTEVLDNSLDDWDRDLQSNDCKGAKTRNGPRRRGGGTGHLCETESDLFCVVRYRAQGLRESAAVHQDGRKVLKRAA